MTRLDVRSTAAHGHADLAGACCWTSSRDLYTAADDGSLSKWSIKGDRAQEIQAPTASSRAQHVTCMHAPTTSSVPHPIATGCADGCLRLLTPSGKLERATDAAHAGAITHVRWNHSGSELATGGEDGTVRTWSALGIVRATVAHGETPVYALAWSPDSASIAYTSGAYVRIESVESSGRPFSFLAMAAADARAGAAVLGLDWSRVLGHLVTVGEDCRYHVWDDAGRELYKSDAFGVALTAAAWRPAGDSFAVALHNRLLLCTAAGWATCSHAHTSGSALALAWTPDGVAVAATCGDGAVLVGGVLDACQEIGNLQVRHTGPHTVQLTDMATGATDDLDLAERVVTFAAGHGRLLVATVAAARVFAVGAGACAAAAAATVELSGPISGVALAPRCFCLLLPSGPQVYDYHGKYLCAPQAPRALAGAALCMPMVALSSDVLALLDPQTRTEVHFFQTAGGQAAGRPLRLRRDDDSRRLATDGNVAVMAIASIALSQTGAQADRLLAFRDSNADLHLASVAAPAPVKVAASCQAFAWNADADILAAVCDTALLVWYHPAACLAHRDLVEATRESRSVSLGDGVAVESFCGAALALRRGDGARRIVSVNPYARRVYELAAAGKWDALLHLCRYLKDRVLWAVFAVLAMRASQLEKAAAAFAAIDQVDKVAFLRELQAMPSGVARRAELLAFEGRAAAAEEALLSGRLLWGAVELNLRLFNWERALALAEQDATDRMVAAVLWHRSQHLQAFGRDPMQGGREHERLPAFAARFRARDVPSDARVEADVHEMRVQEGLVES